MLHIILILNQLITTGGGKLGSLISESLICNIQLLAISRQHPAVSLYPKPKPFFLAISRQHSAFSYQSSQILNLKTRVRVPLRDILPTSSQILRFPSSFRIVKNLIQKLCHVFSYKNFSYRTNTIIYNNLIINQNYLL